MLKFDLERCGIPYQNGAGRVVGLDTLRHGSITALAQAETPIETV
jgi:hypothetical protein